MSLLRGISSLPIKRSNIALILHGCGYCDGTEIYEATSMLIHLSKQNVKVSMFAPDIDQMHVINHLTGVTMHESRNVLIESARLARGDVQSLNKLDHNAFDALLVPGGFGAAKNLSDFAIKNNSCKLILDFESVLKSFHSSKKPIGVCCISPAVISRCLSNIEVTVGRERDDVRWPYGGTAEIIRQMQSKHVEKDVMEIHIDQTNNIVSTPAYMCATSNLGEIFDAIGKLVHAVLRL